MSNHNAIKRRPFLIGTAVAVAGGLVGLPSTAGASATAVHPPLNGPDFVVGTVQDVDPAGVLRVRPRGLPPVTVRLAPGALLGRGVQGRVSGVTAYVRGDEVVAHGRSTGTAFSATGLVSLYRWETGQILRRRGDRFETTAGILQLVPSTAPADNPWIAPRPLDQLAAGDRIGAMVWREPSVRDQLVLRIGVLRAGA
jgi:hypothetical protein